MPAPSGRRKGQMFIITAIFLAGLVSSVQQILFQYSAMDMSVPFRENSIYILQDIKGLVNSTIKGTPDCAEFSAKMSELKGFLDSRIPRGGYTLYISYTINCSTYWNNLPPAPAPLNMTIRLEGNQITTASTVSVYRRG